MYNARMDTLNESKKYLVLTASILLVILSALFLVRFFSEVRTFGMAGSREVSVITLSGHGEVQAVPDIANVYFTIVKDAKTAKNAQEEVAKIEAGALSFLKNNGILEKDIKTENASFYPKYEWRYISSDTPCNEYGCPKPGTQNVIVGYTGSESIGVKVRNTDEVGKIMQGLSDLGVSNMSGPNFSIDNEEVLQAEARQKAILDAKTKAEVLAKDLGVKLGKIVDFNEGGYYPGPMMYSTKAMEADMMASSAPAQIPKGENTISSDVTITYEIR